VAEFTNGQRIRRKDGMYNDLVCIGLTKSGRLVYESSVGIGVADPGDYEPVPSTFPLTIEISVEEYERHVERNAFAHQVPDAHVGSCSLVTGAHLDAAYQEWKAKNASEGLST
jgi:hypothetical protein